MHQHTHAFIHIHFPKEKSERKTEIKVVRNRKERNKLDKCKGNREGSLVLESRQEDNPPHTGQLPSEGFTEDCAVYK